LGIISIGVAGSNKATFHLFVFASIYGIYQVWETASNKGDMYNFAKCILE